MAVPGTVAARIPKNLFNHDPEPIPSRRHHGGGPRHSPWHPGIPLHENLGNRLQIRFARTGAASLNEGPGHTPGGQRPPHHGPDTYPLVVIDPSLTYYY